MPTTPDPRIDAYVAAAPAFARPILERMRTALHAGAPDVEETIKWSRPFFQLDGRPFAYFAAFKAHCTLGFWRGGRPVAEDAGENSGDALGRFGRIESLTDLPSAAALRQIVAEAARAERASRAEAAAKPVAKKAQRPAPTLPDDFAAALAAEPATTRPWQAFAPGQQREYIDWITEAKREETRASRIAQAIGWIAEGKTKNWKYQSN